MFRDIIKRCAVNLRKIKYQLATVVIFIAVIPLTSLQIINFSGTRSSMLGKNDILIDNNILLSSINADSVIDSYRRLQYQISTDEIFLNAMEQYNKLLPDDAESRKSLEQEITDRIHTLCLMYSEVLAVGITDTNGKTVFMYQKYLVESPIEQFFNTHSSQFYSESVNRNAPVLFTIDANEHKEFKGSEMFFISNRIIEHRLFKILGNTVVFIEPGNLNLAINAKKDKTIDFAYNFIMTDDGRVLCTNGRNFTGGPPNLLPDLENVSFDLLKADGQLKAGDLMLRSHKLNNFNLRIVNVVNQKKLMRDIDVLWYRTIGTMIVILLFIVMFMFIFSKRIVKSIERMSYMMNNLKQENFHVEMPEESNTEIRMIEQSYNSMVKRIKNLIDENTDQYEQIIQKTNDIKNAEMKALELQINPHFLFNTLDTINWAAIKGNNYNVSRMLSSLAHILRYNITNINGEVEVRLEVEWLKKYLDLQMARFGALFDYEIDVDESVNKCKVHKLLLQPFVENSIAHGFSGINRTGHIYVSMKPYGEESVQIEICDDGVGMNEDKVRQINEMFENRQINAGFGIGLANITFRLAGYYGDKASIRLDCTNGITKFTMILPKIF